MSCHGHVASFIAGIFIGFIVFYVCCSLLPSGPFTYNSSAKAIEIPIAKRRAVLILGNSHLFKTREFILGELSPTENDKVNIDAVPGRTLETMKNDVIDLKPSEYWHNRLLILEAGVNDLHKHGSNRTWPEVFADFASVIDLVHKSGGRIRLWPIIPWETAVEKVKEYNFQLAGLCREKGAGFFQDTKTHDWIDGVHLTKVSYKRWADRVVGVVMRFLYPSP